MMGNTRGGGVVTLLAPRTRLPKDWGIKPKKKLGQKRKTSGWVPRGDLSRLWHAFREQKKSAGKGRSNRLESNRGTSENSFA